MYSRSAAVLLVVLTCLFSVSALSVNPETQQLSDPKDQTYQYVYSIINNDPQPRTLALEFDQFSEYLSDRVSISKRQFSLLPQEAQNVQISINPHGLGPETHMLKIGVYDAEEKLATLQLLIVVPGTPTEEYAVSVDAKDTTTQNAVPVSVTLSNKGNIIGYGRLHLLITDNSGQVGVVNYPDLVQILPGKSVDYDLVFTDTLKPGFYTAVLNAEFPSKMVSNQDQFTVRLGISKERLELGSDFGLTFASVGNPPAVTYSLTDEDGAIRAEGTFLPQTGDMIVPTSALPAGEYELVLQLPHGEQRITLVIMPERHYVRYGLIAAIILIVLYALFSARNDISLRYKIWRLSSKIRRREEVVNNLINRSHKLLDHLYERRREAGGGSGAPSQRT